jgi:hypothetical protein
MTLPGDMLLSEIYARHCAGNPDPKDDQKLVLEVMSRHFDRYDSFDKLRAKLDWFCDEYQQMNPEEKSQFMEWLSTRYRSEFGYEMLQ